jgi:hypothetical protein
MRIISSQLRQIIREEITRSLRESDLYYSTPHPYPMETPEASASREKKPPSSRTPRSPCYGNNFR